jgi:hypothetical protein
VAAAGAGAWYRQPVLWLGAAIFVASLAGCIATIVVSTRHVDAPVQDVHPRTLLDMPVHAHEQPSAQDPSTTQDARPADRTP